MKPACFLSAFFLLVFCTQSFAASTDAKILKWGADSEGGAPFIFQDPKNPEKIIGYEVDIVNAIATELGMTAEHVQNQWDGLVPGLNRGNYEMIVNGLEITEDRKNEISFSDPYYYTYEQLVVLKNNLSVHTLNDLQGKKAGTLKATLAEKILRATPGLEVLTYEAEVNAYDDLKNGRIDAVLLDAPIVQYHAKSETEFRIIETPIGQMLYGIGIRKNDKVLLQKVNNALDKLRKNGKLREIYERWGMWTSTMAAAFNDPNPSNIQPTMYEYYLEGSGLKRTWKDKLYQYVTFIPMLLKGAVTTLELSLFGMIVAVGMGLLLALMRLYGGSVFSSIALAYIELIRGTPLLIQLFFIFYGLPHVGIKLNPFMAAILGLGLNYAAYEAENYRAGILAIPKSQMEAAIALGMTRGQALVHVILPQAFKIVIAPTTNDFISIIKDSSLVSVITMVELTKMYGQLAATYYDYFGIGILVALMYFLVGLPFVKLARMFEAQLAKTQPKSGSRRFFRKSKAPDFSTERYDTV